MGSKNYNYIFPHANKLSSIFYLLIKLWIKGFANCPQCK